MIKDNAQQQSWRHFSGKKDKYSAQVSKKEIKQFDKPPISKFESNSTIVKLFSKMNEIWAKI